MSAAVNLATLAMLASFALVAFGTVAGAAVAARKPVRRLA